MQIIDQDPLVSERIAQLESEIAQLQERNKRVDADKAWETSGFRKVAIAILTYIVMCLVMLSIGVKDFYVSAIVPTLGFVLSTLSLTFLKSWWKRPHKYKLIISDSDE